MNAPYTPSAKPDKTHIISTVITPNRDISDMVSKNMADPFSVASSNKDVARIAKVTNKHAVTL